MRVFLKTGIVYMLRQNKEKPQVNRKNSKDKKEISEAGNRTPVVRVTGGNT